MLVAVRSLAVVIIMVFSLNPLFAGDIPLSALSDLNNFAKQMVEKRSLSAGYPVNQNTELKEFYQWYINSGLAELAMNNVGNPRKPSPYQLSTHKYENEVVDFFAPLYGFNKNESWGIVTFSGTDGNNHGVYFGAKYLLAKTRMKPVVYVSADAHYSVKKLADLQNLELRLIPTDKMGRMKITGFAKALDPQKPALVVIAMGTTFKGAIDDQAAVDAVLREKKPIAVYRHLDAALFGGYLPFSKDQKVVDRKTVHFDSIAVSGHKFFGFDEPMGIFITTDEVLANQNPFQVAYLNDAVPTITCSRSAIGPLKFWWKIKMTGLEGFKSQSEVIISDAEYLKAKLDEMGYPAWRNPFSNTVFFKRPEQWIMDKWMLAMEEDDRLGGKLAHCIVMQNVTREVIDRFIADMKKGKR